MMNFFNEVAQNNQVELSDIVSNYHRQVQPNVDIIHSSTTGKTNSWSNSKSKRFNFLPAATAMNPGPGHYN
jgi:hypothetical protein